MKNHTWIAKILVFAIVSAPLQGVCAVQKSSADSDLEQWMKVPFAKPSFISRMYKNSIAKGVFVKLEKSGGFLPPIQYFARPMKSNLATQNLAISDDILKSLGVPRGKGLYSTTQVKAGPFKAGKDLKREGYFAEYQSTDNGTLLVTCIVLVKNGDQVLATYTQATKAALPKCTQELVSLAQTDVLFNSGVDQPLLTPRAKKYIEKQKAARVAASVSKR